MTQSESQPSLDGYHRACLVERFGDLDLGLEIRVAGVKTDPHLASIIARHGDVLLKDIWLYAVSHDPQKIESRKNYREFLLGLFPPGQAPYAEEIQNEYCGDPCCWDRPWLVVTGPRGRIKVGPRKRVYNIDWSDSTVGQSARELFPAEDVTMGDNYIHAWGDADFARYLATILNAPESS